MGRPAQKYGSTPLLLTRRIVSPQNQKTAIAAKSISASRTKLAISRFSGIALALSTREGRGELAPAFLLVKKSS